MNVASRLFLILIVTCTKLVIATTCQQGFYQCKSAGFSTKCCPCDDDGDVQSFTCVICPPTEEQCDYLPETKLKCPSGTELIPSNKCYFPEICDSFYCCCQCQAGYYNPDNTGEGSCLSCSANTVSPQKSSTCYDTCSVGTGLDGYGKNPYAANNDMYDDIPPSTDSTMISDTNDGDVDGTTTGVGIDGDLGSSSSGGGYNMPSTYRASANGTQCLNCIPGSFNPGDSFFCSDCPLPYYGSDNIQCLECYPLQLSYYSLSFQSSTSSSGRGNKNSHHKSSSSGAKTMLYYHPCQAVGIGLNISTITPIIIALFILLLLPNVVLLFQKGFQLFLGMVTYTILPITTSVFNLTYILFSFFQSMDTFQLVITFSVWPSLICLFLILFVYHAVPCFYCCQLPSSWYEDDYENITKLIPIIILFFIHLPFYIFWLMVGYFFIVSKTFAIGSISSLWFRVWLGNSRLSSVSTTTSSSSSSTRATTDSLLTTADSLLTTATSSTSATITSTTATNQKILSNSKTNNNSFIDAELLNFLIIFQILFEFFPFLIILLNEKHIIVDNGLNGLYGLESIEVLGIHGLNGLKKMIFLCGLLSCISGIYRLLYYKIYKRIDLLDIPLSCKICGVQLFINNNNHNISNSNDRISIEEDDGGSGNNNIRGRNEADYNILPTAASSDNDNINSSNTNDNNITISHDEEENQEQLPQQPTSSSSPSIPAESNNTLHHHQLGRGSFKKLLFIRLKDVGYALLAVFVYGCFWACNIPKYVRQIMQQKRKKQRGRGNKGEKYHRRSRYKDDGDDEEEADDDDDDNVELRTTNRKSKTAKSSSSSNNNNNRSNSRVQRRHRRYKDYDDDDDTGDSNNDDDGSDDDEGESKDHNHSASSSLLSSYKQDMMTMKNELDSMRSEFIKLKSTTNSSGGNSSNSNQDLSQV